MPTFGTANNPAHMVEIGQDPNNPDPRGPQRPPPGFVIFARNHDTGEVLPPITVGVAGTWAYSTVTADRIDYSLDQGLTYYGPLEADEYREETGRAARKASRQGDELDQRTRNLGWDNMPRGALVIVVESAPGTYAAAASAAARHTRLFIGTAQPRNADSASDGDLWLRTVAPLGLLLRTATGWTVLA